jgi:hypothetical protein
MEGLITIRDIARQRGMHPAYVGNLTRMKGFPEPKRILGTIKLFEPREVAAYFKDREKRRA